MKTTLSEQRYVFDRTDDVDFRLATEVYLVRYEVTEDLAFVGFLCFHLQHPSSHEDPPVPDYSGVPRLQTAFEGFFSDEEGFQVTSGVCLDGHEEIRIFARLATLILEECLRLAEQTLGDGTEVGPRPTAEVEWDDRNHCWKRAVQEAPPVEATP